MCLFKYSLTNTVCTKPSSTTVYHFLECQLFRLLFEKILYSKSHMTSSQFNTNFSRKYEKIFQKFYYRNFSLQRILTDIKKPTINSETFVNCWKYELNNSWIILAKKCSQVVSGVEVAYWSDFSRSLRFFARYVFSFSTL